MLTTPAGRLFIITLAVLSAATCLRTRSVEPDVGADAHVFIRSESVVFPLPDGLSAPAHSLRLLNERLETLSELPASGSIADLGALPVGWYRIEFRSQEEVLLGFTTAAVIEAMAAPPAKDSPIALDVALAWLGAKDQGDWPLMSDLARRAGVGWVRDRIHWREIQEASGQFLPHTKYDDSADIQAASGLKILQVFHTRPHWALIPQSGSERPRTDLLKLYAFCKGMAERFHGRVQAWEPWNEGNAANFGGFTMDELCALQKAAWLGFKAGDPALTVCWNPLGGINRATQVEDLLRNETWPYFDIYSIHSYDWPHGFEGYWADSRNAASGRPIWVTEGDRGMNADPASATGDFTPEMDRRKAEFVTQSYVRSLFSGATRHFHFILGHYMEGENRVQFGLLRADHTPRPGYVALATLGRLLADGRCLGRYEVPEKPEVHVYAFRARPDGVERDVLVAWCEGEFDWPERGRMSAPWPISESLQVEAALDYLGRPLESRVPAELGAAPVFLVLPAGSSDALKLRSVAGETRRTGEASPIVLQFDVPGIEPVVRTVEWTQEAAYEFAPGTEVKGNLTVYNLSEAKASGALQMVFQSTGEALSARIWELALEPMSSQDLALDLTIPSGSDQQDSWLRFTGDFGVAGKPVLSVRSRAVMVGEEP
jgi:hypothetical protein